MGLKKDFAIIFHSVIISKPLCGQCRDGLCDHTVVSEFSGTAFLRTRNMSQVSVNLGCGC